MQFVVCLFEQSATSKRDARANTNLTHTHTHTHTHETPTHDTHTRTHIHTHHTHTHTYTTGAALTKVSSKKASKDEEVNTARVYRICSH
jgi:hypothetical protein